MILKILRYIYGYAKVELQGYSKEQFMNLLRLNDITIWDVQCTDGGYSFYTGKRNIYKMKELIRKTSSKLIIVNRFGLPVFIKKNKGRITFVCGFAFFGIILYILSLFIWEIDIQGNTSLVEENVKDYVLNEIVSIGSLKKSINCAEIEEKLRNHYDEISWISCSVEGTKLNVTMEEGVVLSNTKQDQEPSNIVASKDAVVTRIITRSGTGLVKQKDIVKKGDVLISGTICIYDDNNEVLESYNINADGEVYGQTKYKYDDYVDLTYYEKQYEKDKKTYISLCFGNYEWMPIKPKHIENYYDVCITQKKFRLLGDFYIPFAIKTMDYRQYHLEQKIRTKNEAKSMLLNRLQKKIDSFKEKKVEIMRNNVKIEFVDGKVYAKGSLVLNESIVKKRKVKD